MKSQLITLMSRVVTPVTHLEGHLMMVITPCITTRGPPWYHSHRFAAFRHSHGICWVLSPVAYVRSGPKVPFVSLWLGDKLINPIISRVCRTNARIPYWRWVPRPFPNKTRLLTMAHRYPLCFSKKVYRSWSQPIRQSKTPTPRFSGSSHGTIVYLPNINGWFVW